MSPTTFNDEKCPRCRGSVIEVGDRRWCVKLYAEGGCAGFWVRRQGFWSLQKWHTPLVQP